MINFTVFFVKLVLHLSSCLLTVYTKDWQDSSDECVRLTMTGMTDSPRPLLSYMVKACNNETNCCFLRAQSYDQHVFSRLIMIDLLYHCLGWICQIIDWHKESVSWHFDITDVPLLKGHLLQLCVQNIFRSVSASLDKNKWDPINHSIKWRIFFVHKKLVKCDAWTNKQHYPITMHQW